jgi:hypothetical protein
MDRRVVLGRRFLLEDFGVDEYRNRDGSALAGSLAGGFHVALMQREHSPAVCRDISLCKERGAEVIDNEAHDIEALQSKKSCRLRTCSAP